MADMLTTGIPEVDRRLRLLATREANNITRSAIQVGLTVLANEIDDAIESYPGISRELKRAMKRTVGKRLVTKSRGPEEVAAKAGLGVGKRTAAKRSREAGVDFRRITRGRKGGGLSSANIHWFALGTVNRYTGVRDFEGGARKRKRSERFTGATRRHVGKINRVGAVRIVSNSSRAHVETAIYNNIRVKLDITVNTLRSQ